MSTKPKKKVTPLAVAKDVLAMIAAKKITPKTMIYASMDNFKFTKAPADLQAATRRKGFTCECCAKGAALVAYAHLVDDVPFKGAYSNSEVLKALTPVFGAAQLAMMEDAFELNGDDEDTFEFGIKASGDERWTAKGAKMRLVAVMRNIVKNKGVFKPSHVPRGPQLEEEY
jgi:hypothetical protein